MRAVAIFISIWSVASLGAAQPAPIHTAPTTGPARMTLGPNSGQGPFVLRGQATATDDARGRLRCGGFVASTPQMTLNLESQAGLRLVSDSPVPSRVIVRRPDGATMCSDDRTLAGDLPAGEYAVWIALAAPGTTPYRLTISSQQLVAPAPVAPAAGRTAPNRSAAPPPVAPSRTGDVTEVISLSNPLTTQTFRGRSGGSEDVSRRMGERTVQHGTCAGFVTTDPNYVLRVRDPMRVRLVVRSHHNATLVLQDQAGHYHCADDTVGMHPILEPQLAAGSYAVWIGSARRGDGARYTLGVTQDSGVTPRSLPR